jgi:hypothetical protein
LTTSAAFGEVERAPCWGHSWPIVLLSMLLAVMLPSGAVGGTVGACVIVEGTSIGGVRIGMPVSAALKITGPAIRRQSVGADTIFTLHAPWSQMSASYDAIEMISTSSPACTTASGIGAGSTAAAVREAYAGASASSSTPSQAGLRLSYPFLGVAVLLQGDRVGVVEVFRPDSPVGARWAPAPARPTPPVAASPSWIVRSLSWRLEDTTFAVAGLVENPGPPLSAFAEVNAFDTAGRLIGTSDGPLYPTPLSTGGTAGFEARLTIDDVVNRYTVTVRPVGSITTALAEQVVDVRDRQAFAPLVMRRLTVTIQFKTMPTQFIVTVSNNSSATVAAATIAVDIAGTCLIQMVDQVRSLSYRGIGTVVVAQIQPGSSSQGLMGLPPDVPGGCQELATASMSTRVLNVRIGP